MKSKFFGFFVCLLFVLSATMIFAEGGQEQGAAMPETKGEIKGLEGAKIGFIQLTLGTTYHAAMSDKFEQLAKDAGADLSHVVSQSRSADEQLSLAEDLVAKGVDVLVLNPIGDEIVPSIVKMTENNDIPLICVDNTSPGAGYVYVGIDNFSIAREIGRYIGKQMNKGKMVYVRSTATDTGCPALRFGGIMGGISDQGEIAGFDMIDEMYAPGDVGESEGMKQMEELLAANSHIDIVIAHHDAQALGALKAIRDAGRNDIKMMAGFDGEKRMLEEIKAAKGGKKGGIDLVTGLNSPTMIAEITMNVISKMMAGEEVRSYYYIPVVGINSSNVDKYMEYGF